MAPLAQLDQSGTTSSKRPAHLRHQAPDKPRPVEHCSASRAPRQRRPPATSDRPAHDTAPGAEKLMCFVRYHITDRRSKAPSAITLAVMHPLAGPPDHGTACQKRGVDPSNTARLAVHPTSRPPGPTPAPSAERASTSRAPRHACHRAFNCTTSRARQPCQVPGLAVLPTARTDPNAHHRSSPRPPGGKHQASPRVPSAADARSCAAGRACPNTAPKPWSPPVGTRRPDVHTACRLPAAVFIRRDNGVRPASAPPRHIHPYG